MNSDDIFVIDDGVKIQILVAKLKELGADIEGDFEYGHKHADKLLIEFIDDQAVTAAFKAVGKAYR